jgi:hypothetical protein
MSKRIAFYGIEILTDEGDLYARRLLGFVESVIYHLESDLDETDENFCLFLNMDFSPNRPPKHSFLATNILNNGTRKKVMRILKKSTNSSENAISGIVRVDLQVENV